MTDEQLDIGDERRAVIRAVCDTVVPRLEHPDDEDGFWARTGTDLGADQGVEMYLAGMPALQRDGLLGLLDALGAQGIVSAPTALSREQILRNTMLSSGLGTIGVGSLVGLVQLLAYGMPDPATGVNPTWARWGYPGPAGPPPDVPKPLTPLTVAGDTELTADVVICGSGAGGAVVAATLAGRGLDVVVVEAGGYFNESDFAQSELQAYQSMYWRGGPVPTLDANVTVFSGTALGGGTVVNWTNCLRTPQWVREEWAREHGLTGVDGPEHDAHLDAVLERIGATDAISDFNGPQQRMQAAAQKLGWRFKTAYRNADPDTYDPVTAGYLGFGDQSGSKRSADKTWLLDAQRDGARFLVRTKVQRVLTEGRRAAGIEAVHGSGARVTVRAPQVVVACSAMESPALLMRSGIGGPAVGDHFRFHTCTAAFGIYPEDQRAWWGAPHTGIIHEFEDTGDGYGFLLEATQYAPGVLGSGMWPSGALHKELMSKVKYGAFTISLTRDHGHGRVYADADGEPIIVYPVDDPVDLKNLRDGLEQQIRMHEAAGATEIYSVAADMRPWRRGDDLEAFIARARRSPMRAGGQKLFAAHEMGGCRMGTDPATSVADGRGELHDVKGVWIGDASAFPTTSGVNPMVSIMALARRTAGFVAEAASVGAALAGTASAGDRAGALTVQVRP